MSHEQFLNSPDDIKWMRDKLKSIKGLPRFKSYILRGNEDVPDEVVLYREREPTVMDVPVAKIYHDANAEPYMESSELRSHEGESYGENPRTREIGQHVYDFESASKFLGNKTERTLAPNTKIFYVMQSGYYGNQTIAVRLYGTVIVRYMESGVIQLATGGHHTKTTKQRINQLLPPGFSVGQKNYDWFLHTPEGTYPFVEGMEFFVSGEHRGKVNIRPGSEQRFSNPPRRETKQRYAHLGSISEGTLRDEDLIDTFASELRSLYEATRTRIPPHVKKLLAEAEVLDYGETDDLSEVVSELSQELEHFAPPYAYFGASEGDGADFGFWISQYALDEAIRDGEVFVINDRQRGRQPDPPKNYRGLVLHVSDHGNMTLSQYVNGKYAYEVWSIV